MDVKDIRDYDVSRWSHDGMKLSVTDVCRIFDIDIEKDNRNRFFWNIQLDKMVVITDDLLCWLGYGSAHYKLRKQCLVRILKKNDHIKYNEIQDEKDPRKMNIVLDALDFEELIMQVRTPKAVELRKLYAITRTIVTKYCEYERWYESHAADMLRQQNSQLMSSVDELKSQNSQLMCSVDQLTSLVLTAKQDGDERERRAQEERKRAEDRERIAKRERHRAECERQRAEDERQRAEDERQRAEKERERAEERNVFLKGRLLTTADCLRDDIAHNLVPPPVHPAKRHRLGLFRTAAEGEWYLMRRQFESWKDAERRLVKRSMTRVHKWDDVSHTVDVGNVLKRKCRKLTWYARGNIIRVPQEHREEIRDEHIVDMIEDILSTENAAHRLAEDSTALL